MKLKDIKVGEEYAVGGHVAERKRMVATEVGVVGKCYDRGTEYRSTEADFVDLTPVDDGSNVVLRPVTAQAHDVLRTWAEEVRDRRLRDAAPDMLEALKLAHRVFRSMADRGHYPEELLPDTEHFVGTQGFMFLREAIARAEDAS